MCCYGAAMKTEPLRLTGEPVFRSPVPADGKILHQLATAAGTLDVNSDYAYLLPGLHHPDSSILAEIDGRPAGFVIGYLIPERQGGSMQPVGKRLFVWQVAVHPDFRKRGLANAMLLALATRAAHPNLRFIETTVTSSNTASKRMFQSLAGTLGTEMKEVGTLGQELFQHPHEAETIYRIGPFNVVKLIK